MNEDIQNNTVVKDEALLPSSTPGAPGHSQNNVGEAATVTTAPTPQTSEANAAFAEMRKQNEALQAQLAQATQVATNPEVVAFLKAKEDAKIAEQAAAGGVSPELLTEINSIKAQQAAFAEQQELAAGQASFANFTKANNMDTDTSTEFVGYLENVIPAHLHNEVLAGRIDLSPYVHGFAASKGLMGNNSVTTGGTNATFIPGHGSANSSGGDAELMNELIKQVASTGLNNK